MSLDIPDFKLTPRQANNIRGQWKRAFCSATLVGFGGIGGIAGSLVFRSQDAPDYRQVRLSSIVALTDSVPDQESMLQLPATA